MGNAVHALTRRADEYRLPGQPTAHEGCSPRASGKRSSPLRASPAGSRVRWRSRFTPAAAVRVPPRAAPAPVGAQMASPVAMAPDGALVGGRLPPGPLDAAQLRHHKTDQTAVGLDHQRAGAVDPDGATAAPVSAPRHSTGIARPRLTTSSAACRGPPKIALSARWQDLDHLRDRRRHSASSGRRSCSLPACRRRRRWPRVCAGHRRHAATPPRRPPARSRCWSRPMPTHRGMSQRHRIRQQADARRAADACSSSAGKAALGSKPANSSGCANASAGSVIRSCGATRATSTTSPSRNATSPWSSRTRKAWAQSCASDRPRPPQRQQVDCRNPGAGTRQHSANTPADKPADRPSDKPAHGAADKPAVAPAAPGRRAARRCCSNKPDGWGQVGQIGRSLADLGNKLAAYERAGGAAPTARPQRAARCNASSQHATVLFRPPRPAPAARPTSTWRAPRSIN